MKFKKYILYLVIILLLVVILSSLSITTVSARLGGGSSSGGGGTSSSGVGGSMVDYTINIDTKEIVDGRNTKARFIEYWKFIRKDDNKRVLCEILQEDEKDKIVFN